MKAVAWPGLPVIAAMVAAREGARAATRFAAVAVSTALVLMAAFAPAFLSQPAAFADNIVAYPLGLARHETPAASPLPGHLLASTGSAGRLAALGLLLVAGLAIAVSLARRPPRDARSAALRLALGFTLLFMLAPAARFGYFCYPAALLGWLALTGQAWPGPAPAPGRGTWPTRRRRWGAEARPRSGANAPYLPQVYAERMLSGMSVPLTLLGLLERA